MSTISASTTTTTAYKVTADTTGTLVLQTGSTPTTAVTIDSTQRVGIGYSSVAGAGTSLAVSGNTGMGLSAPLYKLHVIDGDSTTNTVYNIASFERSTSGTAANGIGGMISFDAEDDAGSQRNAAFLTWKLTTASAGSPAGYIAIGSRGASEALAIDNSGNVNLTTSGAAVSFLDTGNTYLSIGYIGSTNRIQGRAGAAASVPLTFWTNDTERARITSDGSFGIGVTPLSTIRLQVKGSAANNTTWSGYFTDSNGNELFSVRNDGLITTGAQSLSPYNYTTASAANAYVNSSGQLQRSTSSLKYKQNVQDAVHGLAELLTLRSVTYEGKSETDAGKTFGGLIAEEVHAAGLTEFVQYAEDETPDALAYGNMVSLCIKAIQEQQAIIETLTNRITALEAK